MVDAARASVTGRELGVLGRREADGLAGLAKPVWAGRERPSAFRSRSRTRAGVESTI
jgi:hypothetical protein